MTLIEILVAISISTLILGIALSAYVTVSGSLRRQNERRRDAAIIALDGLRHDLAACLQAASSNVPAFRLDTATDGNGAPSLSTLGFCAGKLDKVDDDFARLGVVHLRYTVQRGEADSGNGTLTREALTLWGAQALAPPTSNRLLGAVSRFDVTVLDGTTWTNRWQSTPARPLPRAARIKLDWDNGTTTETASVLVFIPAGNTIKPAPPTK